MNMSDAAEKWSNATNTKNISYYNNFICTLLGVAVGAFLQMILSSPDHTCDPVPHSSPSELAAIACSLSDKCFDVGKIICAAAGMSCTSNITLNDAYVFS